MNYGLVFALAYGVFLLVAAGLLFKYHKKRSSYEMSASGFVVILAAFGLIAAVALPFVTVNIEAIQIRNAAMRVEGVPDVRLATSGARAIETLSENINLNIDWSNSDALPEDVLRKLAENQGELLRLLQESAR